MNDAEKDYYTVILWFDKNSEKLAGEAEITHYTTRELYQIISPDDDDPSYVYRYHLPPEKVKYFEKDIGYIPDTHQYQFELTSYAKPIRVYVRVKSPKLRGLLHSKAKRLREDGYFYRWDDSEDGVWSIVRTMRRFFRTTLGVRYRQKDKRGIYVVDDREQELLEEITTLLSQVHARVGIKQPNDAYLNCPLLDEITDCAAELYERIKENEAKVKAQNPRYWDGEENWDQVPI